MSRRKVPTRGTCPTCGRTKIAIVNGKWVDHNYPNNGRCYRSGKPY